MDTVVNRGGSSTQSDILVVDNATTSSAPTVLTLNTLKGQVGLSEKEGIKLVEVLGTSDATRSRWVNTSKTARLSTACSVVP